MTKVSEHIPSGFSMYTISLIKSIENKHNVHRGKDCMKKFFESLKEHAMKIINFEKRKARAAEILLKNPKICYIYKETFEDKYAKVKK